MKFWEKYTFCRRWRWFFTFFSIQRKMKQPLRIDLMDCMKRKSLVRWKFMKKVKAKKIDINFTVDFLKTQTNAAKIQSGKNTVNEINLFIHFSMFYWTKMFFFFFFTCRLQSIVLFDQNVTNWMKNVFRLMSVNELKTRSTKSGHQKKSSVMFFHHNRAAKRERSRKVC